MVKQENVHGFICWRMTRMHTENVKILGKYSFRHGGTISILMGPNMEYGTEASTMIHEMYHMHLMTMTSIGFVVQILEMERVLSEGKDEEQNRKMEKYTQILYKRIQDVQEIYANNMELLWLEETRGVESAKESYDNKPKSYKMYCDCLDSFTKHKEYSLIDKQNWVNYVCQYAMNICIYSEEFFNALESDKKLVKFFESDNHPNQRLKKAIESHKSDINIEVESPFILDALEFVKKLKVSGVLKYSSDFIEEIEGMYNILDCKKVSPNDLESFNETYHRNIMESIKVFDFSTIKVLRDNSYFDKSTSAFFVIKNCMNLNNQDENYYLIGHSVYQDKPTYISSEVTRSKLSELLKSAVCVLVHFNEYDSKACAPQYFEANEKPVLVIIDDYRECHNWLQNELLENEFLIGNLYENSVGNFFTLLLFSKRNDPNTIYVFPTTKSLAQNLIDHFNLKDSVYYSNKSEFLRILACLENEPNMLKALQWLLAFFTNSKGEFVPASDSAAKMTFDLTRTLLDSVFEIKIKDFYKCKASLPTRRTIGKPFYTLMQHEGGINTGVIKAETNGAFPIFFYNKQQAVDWMNKSAIKNPDLKTFQVVGIDRRYWDSLKGFLLKTKKKICVCLDTDTGKGLIAEVKDIDTIIGKHYENSFCK